MPPRQGHRRQRGSDQRRQGVGAAISTADGSFQILTGVQAASSSWSPPKASAVGDAQLLRRPAGFSRAQHCSRTRVGAPIHCGHGHRNSHASAQTSEATSVLGPLDLALRDDLVSALRLNARHDGGADRQMGAQASLFIRGGNPDANKILFDGVDAGDLGNQFDFGPLSTTAVESAEVLRGPDSSLYGAGAGNGVISLTTRAAPRAFRRFSSKATLATSPPLTRNWKWPGRTTGWITWAPSVGSRLPTICPMTSTT